jgi:hypothetical protein
VGNPRRDAVVSDHLQFSPIGVSLKAKVGRRDRLGLKKQEED